MSPIFPCKSIRRNMKLSSNVQKFASVIPTLKTRITPRDGKKARSYFYVRCRGKGREKYPCSSLHDVENRSSIKEEI